MGFFDGVRNFFGGHGVSLTATQIEGQSPDAVSFPLTDSVMKGRFQVHGKKSATILSHDFLFEVRRRTPEQLKRVVLAQDKNEGTIPGSKVSWPYEIAADQTVDDSFCLIRIDIPAALAELGFSDPNEALRDPSVEFSLILSADVKGSPMDANAIIKVTVTPAAAQPAAEPAAEPAAPEAPAEAWIRSPEAWQDRRPWLERFHEMVAELQANPEVEITELRVSQPASEAELEAARAYHAIPPALEALYRQANGLTLRWQVRGQDEVPVRGDIRVLPVGSTFRSWKDNVWYDEEWDDGAKKPFHPVDYFVDEAYVAVYLTEDGGDAGMRFHEGDDLQLSVEAWLEALLRSRGFWYWPTAIVADLTGREYTTSPGIFRAWMPRLFPDYHERVFFRRSYGDSDAETKRARDQKLAAARAALSASGAQFEVRDTGFSYIHIHFVDSPANYARLVAAGQILGVELGEAGDWSARSIGSLMFIKEQAL